MNRKSHSRGRRGAVAPIIAISMIAILGFVALAVDVGVIASARTQCQNAADTAAMSAARTLNGDNTNNYNVDNVQPNAISAASANMIAGNAVAASQVQVSIGSYTYNYTTNAFVQTIPTAANDTPNLVQAVVTSSTPNMFANTFGINTFATSATAVAVHRPRDVAVVLDLSRSMRFDSMMGIPYYGTRQQSNNPETVFPLFGHYSATASAALQVTGSGPTFLNSVAYGLANITVDTNSGTAIVKDFYQNALGASPVAAFTPAADSYATTPAGDSPLYVANTPSSGYATTVKDYTGGMAKNVLFETLGYDANRYDGSTWGLRLFKGYTQGPRYWGKTFFLWPPDPRPLNDWRGKFFSKAGTSTPVNDNTLLWDNSGAWLAPSSSTYSVNYTAILAWIKSAPVSFPPQLRAGRILYYDSIPSTIDTSSLPPTNSNQRFWKEYIDWVLGINQDYSSSNYQAMTANTGYGDDYTWGSPKISAKPVNGSYMNYQDNPLRPKTHFWFGPMTMLDFLGSTNFGYENYPGTCHEAPNWQCKLGIQAAILDIQNNHPNDFVSLMYYNTPNFSVTDTGCFNAARVPLGRSYQTLSDTLWFPPTTIQNPGTEIRLTDPANNDVPRASNGTSMPSGLMLAYNQLSSQPALRTFASSPAPSGQDGGYGRKGARKLVIFETDGVVNTPVSAPFTNGGAYNSYYNIRQPTEFPTSSSTAADQQTYMIANQITALDTASPPGYSTPLKPALIHCIGFGSIFEPSASGNAGAAANQQTALTLLQQLQFIGNTQSDPSTPLASYKIITGTPAQRINSLRQAFSTIMQDGVQVSLIR